MHSLQRPSVVSVDVALAFAFAALGIVLAWHHPVGGWIVAPVFFILLMVMVWKFRFWPVWVMAAMPVIGFAPWTGWLTFEEFDLLILATAAAGCLNSVFSKERQPSFWHIDAGSFVLLLVFAVFFGVSVLISMFKGFDDAGGFEFGWFHGYFEPMNSVRLGKCFFLATLLIFLWGRAEKIDALGTNQRLGWGMVAGLVFACLAAIWERVAFVGLLNFSSDYRTTALFWETHVGGAAFDGYLAITVPFALLAYLRAKTTPQLGFAGSVLIVATYVCLTTFSRGVYLAVPVGVAIVLYLHFRKTPVAEYKGAKLGHVPRLITMIVLFGVAAWLVFPTSGYRGMLATLAGITLLHPVMSVTFQIGISGTGRQITLVAILATATGLLFWLLVPKGAYLSLGTGVAITIASLYIRRHSRWAVTFALAGYWLTILGCGLVAFHWGGSEALQAMLPICFGLLFAFFACSLRKVPTLCPQWHMTLIGVMLLICFMVGTFSGGRYMAERFETSGNDFERRLAHWNAGLSLLEASDMLFGKGLGRYPASHFFASDVSEHPGGFRLIQNLDGGESYLMLSGGHHVLGWGELLRVSQRVAPGMAPYFVEWDVKADANVRLHVEICEKHLLYNAICVGNSADVKPKTDTWQHISMRLVGDSPSRGNWYAPKLIVFSIAVETRGGFAYLDNLMLHDAAGSAMLKNGNFSAGLGHWFSSSDRHHMPWHMKNLFMHTLFDQGVLGLMLLMLAFVIAFWRVTLGKARDHTLAPALAGALVSFVVVGMFDSLLDVPRIAIVFYFLLMLALVVQQRAPNRQGKRQIVA